MKLQKLLSSTQHSDLFIVGHAAPEQTRTEMVDWLKARYPHVKILALNSANHRQLAGADYNAILNGPDEWLSMVTAALSRSLKTALRRRAQRPSARLTDKSEFGSPS